jgi:L-fuculose-phosphate aldolase
MQEHGEALTQIMDNMQIREELVHTARSFLSYGLCVGRSGNLSARTEQGFLITPSGVFYDDLVPNLIVEVGMNGESLSGEMAPSSEWRIHKDLYMDREEINSVVHVHSPYATAVACTRSAIPAFHYEVALIGGDSIRCAEYATFGTEELSKNVRIALKDRMACLLANHGQIAVGENIATAMNMAQVVEGLARQYMLSESLGGAVLLSETEMRINVEKFKRYGGKEDF